MSAIGEMTGCTCGPWFGVPPCPYHTTYHTTNIAEVPYPAVAPPISDADVERIARRVAELLGFRRATKYTESPTPEAISEAVSTAVMSAICEYFWFAEEGASLPDLGPRRPHITPPLHDIAASDPGDE